MSDELRLEVITPEKNVYKNYEKEENEDESSPKIAIKEKVESILITLTTGEKEILPGHTPFIGKIDSSLLELRKEEGKKKYLVCHYGFLEVLDNYIKIIANAAEKQEDIDKERAQEAKERAEKRLQEQKEDTDLNRAKEQKKRAEKRLTVAEKK